MQYLVIGHDAKDENARERRKMARPKHIELGNKLMKNGNFWFGAALTNENGEAIGSALIMNFETYTDLQKWLSIEPYILEKVWENYEIRICSVRDPWLFSQSKEYYDKTGGINEIR
ncbi:MAG TPA: YciI family protein [Candidatus Limnocylindrales bacterium]|nr:YciI family protein [Candidatus Limnocylindrales bacterium]